MEIQKIRTTLTRQMLDNIYLTNSPRMAVQSTPEGAPLANLDDLLTVRPGGVVRHWGSTPPTPLVVPFMGASGIQALEYMDTVLESRTGVTKYNQGLDANSLNKTATGISAIMSASQQRLELIARIFAETGVKQIFKLIQHCLMTYQNKSMIIRLTDEYVEVDPREWSAGYDMVINVGLGTGDKDQQLMHLMKMAEAQFQFIQMGAPIVTMENIYNTQAKIAENAGFKSIEQFWSDPKKAPQQQQQPDPAQQAAQQQAQAEQGKMQLEQAKMQQSAQASQQQAQMQSQIEQAKLQASQQTEQMKAQAAQQIEAARLQAAQETERIRLSSEQAMEAMRLDFERWKVERESETKIMVAQIGAHTTMGKAEIDAQTKRDTSIPRAE
jgi:acetyl/propionyl-CoA carboxylase alpha subunit